MIELKTKDVLVDSKDPDLAKAQRESRGFHTDIAATMPQNRADGIVLLDVADYFGENPIDVWIQCRMRMRKPTRLGRLPLSLARSMREVLDSGGRKGLAERLARRFLVTCGVLTIESGMTHHQVVADLKRRLRGFAGF